MRDLVQGLLVAFGLYSALPLPQAEWKHHTMRYALGFLPLIGVLVGMCQLGWLWLARYWDVQALFYAAGAVAIPIILTGGIHLDGFADTCDAVCSYGDKEKKLAILKDPHIGAFGVLWLIVLLIGQLGLAAQLYEVPQAAGIAAVGYVLARACGGYMIVACPCAKDSGLAHLFADHTDKTKVAWVMRLWMVFCACCLIGRQGWFGVLTVCVTAGFFVLYVRRCSRLFGGITGDLCGMCITLCELIALFAAVIGGLCMR